MHHHFRDEELEAMRRKVADLEKALKVAQAAAERRAAQLSRDSAERAWRVAFRPAGKE